MWAFSDPGRAGSMTPSAQQALRRTMELYSSTTRFALACNTSGKIIEPIQSRCAILRYTRLTDEEVLSRVVRVCAEEGVSYEDKGLEALLFTAEGDMRNALNNLQATHAGFGHISQENVFKVRCGPPPCHPATRAAPAEAAWRAREPRFATSRTPRRWLPFWTRASATRSWRTRRSGWPASSTTGTRRWTLWGPCFALPRAWTCKTRASSWRRSRCVRRRLGGKGRPRPTRVCAGAGDRVCPNAGGGRRGQPTAAQRAAGQAVHAGLGTDAAAPLGWCAREVPTRACGPPPDLRGTRRTRRRR